MTEAARLEFRMIIVVSLLLKSNGFRIRRKLDAGQTLTDYLLTELERLAARPTRAEMLARLHRRKRVTLKTPAAVVIRDERESA